MRIAGVLALGLVLCCLLGAWLAVRMQRWRASARGRVANARGKRGERSAERILAAHGYSIVARQSRTSYRLVVDGAVQQVELVMDLIVERGGEQIIAEVKTGSSAPRLERAETRRQLLEYQLATGSRCVLLVDADAETITEVAFAGTHAPRAAASAWRAVAIVALLLLAAAWWTRRNATRSGAQLHRGRANAIHVVH